MSYNGGYKVISLAGKNFEVEGEQTFPGIYDKIEDTNRAILVSGLVVDSVEVDDFFAGVTISGQDYVLSGNGYELNIAADDGVTCHVVTANPSDAMENGNYVLQLEVTSSGTAKRWVGVPEFPSDDGTYKLTCTVTSGVPLLTWEEEETV